mmetsp:Transcript_9591/g.34238  ORF Transcript_9591/g.34238 Transcript_9591/m.34238 type:complete len:247 (-) Transcript_9591:877-1617(-)
MRAPPRLGDRRPGGDSGRRRADRPEEDEGRGRLQGRLRARREQRVRGRGAQGDHEGRVHPKDDPYCRIAQQKFGRARPLPGDVGKAPCAFSARSHRFGRDVGDEHAQTVPRIRPRGPRLRRVVGQQSRELVLDGAREAAGELQRTRRGILGFFLGRDGRVRPSRGDRLRPQNHRRADPVLHLPLPGHGPGLRRFLGEPRTRPQGRSSRRFSPRGLRGEHGLGALSGCELPPFPEGSCHASRGAVPG